LSRALHVVGVGGTTRAESGTELAVRHVLRLCQARHATTRLFSGAELGSLPHYSPEHRERVPAARALVEELRRADAVVLGSSAYHGSISGLVKNAIDYTQDMMDDDRPYLSGRPVGCIATGAGWQGVVTTLEHLRAIVHALRGWPTPLGVAINTRERAFGPTGEPLDPQLETQLGTMADELLAFVSRWQASGSE
jgi:FMN reductase